MEPRQKVWRLGMNYIASVRLTPEQKSYCLAKINRINLAIKKWSSIFPSYKIRTLRNMILREETQDLTLPEDRTNEFIEDSALIRTIQVADSELNNRSLQDAILQNYNDMVHKLAIITHKYNKTKMQFEDFLQECYMQVIESMFSWLSDNGADLSTYIYNCLKNRLINVVNQQCTSLSRLTNHSLSLLYQYRKEAERSPSANSQEVIESMNISDKNKTQLTDALHTHTPIQRLSTKRDEFLVLVGNQNPTELQFEITHNEEKEYVLEVLNSSNLTPIELELMMKTIFEKNWRKEYAQKICPETQKPYGYHKISTIIKRASQKVAIEYSRHNS